MSNNEVNRRFTDALIELNPPAAKRKGIKTTTGKQKEKRTVFQPIERRFTDVLIQLLTLTLTNEITPKDDCPRQTDASAILITITFDPNRV